MTAGEEDQDHDRRAPQVAQDAREEAGDASPAPTAADLSPPGRRWDGFVAATALVGMAAGFLLGSRTDLSGLLDSGRSIDGVALSRAVPWKPEIAAGAVERREIARLQEEMRSLRAKIEAMRRASETLRVGDRLRALEGGRQNDQEASRVADKAAAEKIDRLEARLDLFERSRPDRPIADAAPKSESAAPPAAKRKKPKEAEESKAPGGYVLRDAFGAVALVERPDGAVEEVSKGDRLPGAGQVKAIEKRGRAWVVVTSRGVIDESP